MTAKQTFEQFIKELFIERLEVDGVPITKENADDMFDEYLSNLEGEDWLSYGALYGQSRYLAGKEEIMTLVNIK